MNRGFTLLEFVIALLLLAVMTPLLYNGLRLGARTWDAVEERARSSQDRHLAGLFLTRQVEQAQPLPLRKAGPGAAVPISFSGEAGALRFVSPLPAHLGAGGMHWFTISVADAAGGKRLMLSYQLFQTGEWERFFEREPVAAVLTSGLRDARFDYFGSQSPAQAPGWAAQWLEQERLPQLVRLRLVAADGRAEELVMAPRLAMSPPKTAGVQ